MDFVGSSSSTAGIYLEELPAGTQGNTCAPVFSAAVFVDSKGCQVMNTKRCPSIYIMKLLFSQEKEQCPDAIWMDLFPIIHQETDVSHKRINIV